MSRKVISNRGEEVDFDVLELKQKLANAPKANEVVQRERFIDKKRRRTAGSRKINELLAEQAENQRYAKEMLDASRAAKKIADEGEESTPVAEIVNPPIADEDRPKRINRRVR